MPGWSRPSGGGRVSPPRASSARDVRRRNGVGRHDAPRLPHEQRPRAVDHVIRPDALLDRLVAQSRRSATGPACECSCPARRYALRYILHGRHGAALPRAELVPPRRRLPGPAGDHPLVLQDLVTNDFAIWPYPYKRYAEDLPRTPLPRELSGLGRVLYLSAGVVRTTEREGRPKYLFRAAGSAGGRFPLELYVSGRTGSTGTTRRRTRWVRIAPPAGGEATTLIVTGVPWRTAWRYAERGFRHLYWDAGRARPDAGARARGSSHHAVPGTPGVSELVGADGTREFPLALVALGDGAPRIEPPRPRPAAPSTHAPRELPLITAAQRRAGDEHGTGSGSRGRCGSAAWTTP